MTFYIIRELLGLVSIDKAFYSILFLRVYIDTAFYSQCRYRLCSSRQKWRGFLLCSYI